MTRLTYSNQITHWFRKGYSQMVSRGEGKYVYKMALSVTSLVLTQILFLFL